MPKAKFYTYVHRRRDTGAVFYVGKGMGYRCHDRRNRNKHWTSIASKHGFDVEVIAYFYLESDAFDHERALIAELRSSNVQLVNMTDGGEGVSGKVISQEQRAKISAALKGRRPSEQTILALRTYRRPNGGELTQEHKDAISAAKKGTIPWNAGRRMSAEERARRGWPTTIKPPPSRKISDPMPQAHREKISAALKGRQKAPFTDAHKENMSKARRLYWASKLVNTTIV